MECNLYVDTFTVDVFHIRAFAGPALAQCETRVILDVSMFE